MPAIVYLALWNSYHQTDGSTLAALTTLLTAHPGVFFPPSCWSIHCGGLAHPPWLTQDPAHWPQVTHTNVNHDNETETRKTCLVSIVAPNELILLTRYSSYTRLKRVPAWILRYVHNCRVKSTSSRKHGPLSVSELDVAGNLWVRDRTSMKILNA